MNTEHTSPVRRLKNLRIDEISSVDRGANPGARVIFSKRDADLDDEIAKAFRALNPSCESILTDPTLNADD
jgi:hypothetical protein